VSDYDTRQATRYLPHVVVATTAVAGVPVVAVWWLRSLGAIASPWVGVAVAMALSLVASCVGRAYWKRRRGPRDLLFGELLVWGWLRRVRMERQLARSMELLRADEPPGGEVETAGRRFRILSRLARCLGGPGRLHRRPLASGGCSRCAGRSRDGADQGGGRAGTGGGCRTRHRQGPRPAGRA
jgi:hypothetical protein